MELESVQNNVKLLSEMLDSYDPGKSSTEDVELMKELHDSCERLKPTIIRLATESQDNDEMIGKLFVYWFIRLFIYLVIYLFVHLLICLIIYLFVYWFFRLLIYLLSKIAFSYHLDKIKFLNKIYPLTRFYCEIGEVLAAKDELGRVSDKYTSVIVLGRVSRVDTVGNNAPSLLDLSSPADVLVPCSNLNTKSGDVGSTRGKSDMEMLGDIFSSIGNTLEASSSNHETGLLMSDTNIMQPISILPTAKAKGKSTDKQVTFVCAFFIIL